MYMKTGKLMFFNRKPTRTSLRIFHRSGSTASWRTHRERKFFFSHEQCGNVYENKGSLWKSAAKPGMSMKIKVVIRLKPECI